MPQATASLLMGAFAVLGTGAASSAQEVSRHSSLCGSATYRERIALPPDAVFEATLFDVSRAGAQAQEIGRQRLEPAGNPPFRFSIEYDPAQILENHRYAVRATVTLDGRLLFTTDRVYAMPTDATPLELLLVKAATTERSTAALQDTYWKLVTVSGQAVAVAPAQREPHLVLASQTSRASGFGGCNQFTGSYTLSGTSISFGQLAGTMRACVSGGEFEQAFLRALGQVAGWRIEGEKLHLLDAAGAVVATFESRYL